MASFIDVFKRMVDDNLDLWMIPLRHLMQVQKTKFGGKVTIAVDDATATRLLSFMMNQEKLVGGLIVGDGNHFLKAEKEVDSPKKAKPKKTTKK